MLFRLINVDNYFTVMVVDKKGIALQNLDKNRWQSWLHFPRYADGSIILLHPL